MRASESEDWRGMSEECCDVVIIGAGHDGYYLAERLIGGDFRPVDARKWVRQPSWRRAIERLLEGDRDGCERIGGVLSRKST